MSDLKGSATVQRNRLMDVKAVTAQLIGHSSTFTVSAPDEWMSYRNIIKREPVFPWICFLPMNALTPESDLREPE